MPTDNDNGYLMASGFSPVVWNGLQNAELTTTTMYEDDVEYLKLQDGPYEMSFQVRPWRMSRKRFKKILMSCGVSRDAAEQCCKKTIELKIPYSIAYSSMIIYVLGHMK